MATIDYKQLATPEANLIELLAAQNQDGTYSAKLMGSEPFAVLAAKTIYNAYNDIEANISADVEGPASSTDNAIARFDGTTGKIIQNSLVTIDDLGGISTAEGLTVSNVGLARGIFFVQGASQRGQIIYTSGAIQFLSGTTTNGLVVGSSTSQLQFNNAALATLTGSLTVGGTLGVGTASPLGTIGVTGSATTTIVIPRASNGSTASPAETQLIGSTFTNGTYAAGVYALNSFTNNSGNWLAFKTTDTANTTATRMTLDSTGASFTGNATVGGTLTVSGNALIRNALGYATGIHSGTTSDSTQQLLLTSSAAYNHAYLNKTGTTLGIGFSSLNGSFAADDTITITAASKLTTLAGNLTVSGTGTSSVAGNFVASSPDSWRYNAAKSGSKFVQLTSDASFANDIFWDSSSALRFSTGTAQDGTGYTERARFTSSGNLLLGTTTDSANGKLQLATGAADKTSGIGFSSDTSLYRVSGGNVALDHIGGTNPNLKLYENSVQKAFFATSSGSAYLGTYTANSLYFYTNLTTALTLDSSQNAILAGSLAASVDPSTKWGIDFAYGSPGTYVTIADNGTFDLAGGSGMVFVWDNAGNGVSQIMCYYGQTAILWQDSTLYTTTVDSANKVNVYYNSGTSKYRIQNKSGSSKNFFVSTIRLRTSV